MKTKEQILKWLDEQPWKGEFYEGVFFYGSKDHISYNKDFIKGAFCWGYTKSGKASGGCVMRLTFNGIIRLADRTHGRSIANKIQLRKESAVLIGILIV